jgi:hypothetical protein
MLKLKLIFSQRKLFILQKTGNGIKSAMSTSRSHTEEVEVQLLSFLTLALDGGQ